MAIVDLGTRTIPSGGTPVLFDAFDYRDARAYGIILTITPQLPNNIFSRLYAGALLAPDSGGSLYHHQIQEIDILLSPRMLLLPFSNIYDSNGSAQLRIERRNIIRNGSDMGDVTINAVYDDDADIRTWL